MCADRFTACWDELRPVGAQLYFSLPARVGLRSEWTILMNALVILAATLVGLRACLSLLVRHVGWLRWVLVAAILAIHMNFTGGVVRNTLTDLPAGGAALLSIWILCLASTAQRPWMYLVSGGLLGLSAMVRAYFLYPSFICVGVVLAVTALRKGTRVLGLPFLAAYVVPVLFQLVLTHHHTGEWTFIGKGAMEYGERTHFDTVSYGYDTFVPEWGFHYKIPECFRTSSGVGDALQKHAYGEVACVVGYRQWFYFGSHTSFGEVYLRQASDRHFSVALFCANIAVAITAVAWLLRRVRRRPLLLSVLAFLGAIWAEGSVIIPETRFMVVVYVTTWVIAFTALVDVVTRKKTVETIAKWLRLGPAVADAGRAGGSLPLGPKLTGEETAQG